MDFSKYDGSELLLYAEEVKSKWGNTDAYRQYEEKTKDKSASQMKDSATAIYGILSEFASVSELFPESEAAQKIVARLQLFISKNFYPCTKEILFSLGQMYVSV